jgi:hypothetical protein
MPTPTMEAKMLREEVELVRSIVKEEIAAALAAIKPAKAKVEIPEPVVGKVEVEVPLKKGK